MLEPFQDYRAVKRPVKVCLVFLGLALYVSPLFYLGVLVMLLDIRARYCEFLYWRGKKYNPYAIHAMRSSWCSRGVAEAVWPWSRAVYYTLGYRSYHVLPDGFPRVFLMTSFWRSVVGLKGGSKWNIKVLG